ncbi:hypothetical protein EGW08_023344, partial [Elysia chlorotica]
CGGNLYGDNGTINSPEYPHNYRNGAKCVWSISVERGKEIRLTFHQFALEWHRNCVNDWLLIYDNFTSRANPLAKKCGFSIPEPIWSIGNQIFVEFHSDLGITKTGFRASWAAEYTAPNSDDECGGNLYGDNGTINSPDYPHNYRNGAKCVWSISVERGKEIRLTFHEFALEWHLNCLKDWLVIYDNFNLRANPLAKKCGFSIPEPIWSIGNQIFVEFNSD